MAIFLLCGFMEYGDKGVEKPIKNALKKVVVLNVFHNVADITLQNITDSVKGVGGNGLIVF